MAKSKSIWQETIFGSARSGHRIISVSLSDRYSIATQKRIRTDRLQAIRMTAEHSCYEEETVQVRPIYCIRPVLRGEPSDKLFSRHLRAQKRDTTGSIGPSPMYISTRFRSSHHSCHEWSQQGSRRRTTAPTGRDGWSSVVPDPQSVAARALVLNRRRK